MKLKDQARLLRAEFTISIAQPGLSKTAISEANWSCLLLPKPTFMRRHTAN